MLQVPPCDPDVTVNVPLGPCTEVPETDATPAQLEASIEMLPLKPGSFTVTVCDAVPIRLTLAGDRPTGAGVGVGAKVGAAVGTADGEEPPPPPQALNEKTKPSIIRLTRSRFMQNRIIAPENGACDASAAKVPRKKRGGSSLSDVRHLLRHLNDPQEVAANALTADIFRARAADGAGVRECMLAVRAAIAQAIQRLGTHAGNAVVRERNRRAATILQRCDLDGAAHPEVALELGVSRRQFYRDRDVALRLLTAELEARLPAPASASTSVIDTAALAFDAAEALLALGKFGDAKLTLERIAESTESSTNRLYALAELVDIECEEMCEPDALAHLHRARSVWQSSGEGDPLIYARLALAESSHATLLGNLIEAATHREQSIAALRRSPASPASGEMLIRTLLAEASALRERGEQRAAMQTFEDAQQYLDQRQRQFHMLQALILNEKGATMMLLPGRLADASRMHQRAAGLARERRFMRIALASLLNDCAVDYWQGKPRTALATARGVLEAARDVVFSQEYARMALTVSSFALAAKDAAAAFDLVNDAGLVATDAGALRSRAILAEARLRLRTGDHARALELAQDAYQRLERTGVKALLGSALLYMAEAHAELAQHREAIEAIDRAIEQLERSGSPFHLSKAHRLAAKLTGMKSHAKRAHEIAATLVVNRSRS